jgi:membrane protein implicated in regulation of membrane protease activity
MDGYDLFFSICLGLFIGGLLFSIISVFLAQMESQSLGQEIDTDVDIDADVDMDVDVDIDVDMDVDVDVDVDMDVDVDVDVDMDVDADADTYGTTTSPAPIMLLASAFLLVFGISGISLYYIITTEALKFLMFIGSPSIALISSKYINVAWKYIAKSQYYKISSTQYLIGREGEVVLPIDERGGVIRINSTTPMKYEKLHVMPYDAGNYFERGMKVYIVAVKDNKLTVSTDKSKISKKK